MQLKKDRAQEFVTHAEGPVLTAVGAKRPATRKHAPVSKGLM